ncbi:ankyrin repeat domain-containing protein [Alkalilimnicola sp. S0819]|uniref:ankyrin repeat domain-containing protein n=1 Tax=Alkalilimnicola sp. S0819 TaxID=2613922 RepID=UPI0012619EB7|nr:ankyrin repeat domain-containing protein [Alkalilimnicola sp. S0819]KAB7624158.1 hypothetical protein F3N43_07150 [Alkalilimnicola sp. S0819]MPQ16411.1 hypothetical protein [Alkalilimnicola sp. S0819]
MNALPRKILLTATVALFALGCASAPEKAALREALFEEDYARFEPLYLAAANKNELRREDGGRIPYLVLSLLASDPRFFELIVQHADPDFPGTDDTTALFDAVAYCDQARVGVLLAKGADVNYRSSVSGLTPLHMVAVTDCLTLAERLLAAGADRNAETRDGDRPVDFAIRMGQEAMASRLSSPAK